MFSHAVVMTLDKRVVAGELGNAADLLRKGGLPVLELLVGDKHRIPGREYWWEDQEASPRKQAFNYTSAFLKAVRSWRDTNAGPVLYLEDDAEFVTSWLDVLPKALRELQAHEYDMFYLGGNYTCGPVEKISEHLLRSRYALDLHAVVFHPRCYEKLLRITPSAHHTIDGLIGDMQQCGELVALGVHPSICYQKPQFSWNENRYDNKTDRQLRRYW